MSGYSSSDDVGRPRGQQLFHQFHDFGDRFGGPDIFPRGQYPKRGHVLAEQGDLAVREVAPVDAVALRALE